MERWKQKVGRSIVQKRRKEVVARRPHNHSYHPSYHSMHTSSSHDCVNCTLPRQQGMQSPQTEDEAFELILVVLVPCIVSVTCLLCCARIFYVYYSYRRHHQGKDASIANEEKKENGEKEGSNLCSEEPSVSVIQPPPNYDQILKHTTNPLPPPAYSVQAIQTVEADSQLPPHYTPSED